jgi:Zn finger protein HypA/HybF involved in hydrogenase expression
MGLWSKLFRRETKQAEEAEPVSEADAPTEPLIELPAEPFVFECRTCGKVFEARRKKPLCPECDSKDVELVSG